MTQAPSLAGGAVALPLDADLNTRPKTKAREQIAGDLYKRALDAVKSGDTNLWLLASHIVSIVEGVTMGAAGSYEGPLWKERAFQDKTIVLDRFEDYLLKPAREGLGVPSLLRLYDTIKHCDNGPRAIEILKREIPDFMERVKAERDRAAMKQTPALEKRGRPSKDKKCSERTFTEKAKRGENREYLAARLNRDHPEIARKVAAGEYPSIRAAAIDAGIVKPSDPLKAIARQIEKLAPPDMVAVHRDLTRRLPDDAYDRVEAAREAINALTESEMSALAAEVPDLPRRAAPPQKRMNTRPAGDPANEPENAIYAFYQAVNSMNEAMNTLVRSGAILAMREEIIANAARGIRWLGPYGGVRVDAEDRVIKIQLAPSISVVAPVYSDEKTRVRAGAVQLRIEIEPVLDVRPVLGPGSGLGKSTPEPDSWEHCAKYIQAHLGCAAGSPGFLIPVQKNPGEIDQEARP